MRAIGAPWILAAQPGFQPPSVNELFNWPNIVTLHLGPLNLGINRTVLLMFLGAIVVVGLFRGAFRRPKLVPRGLQNVMEALIDFIRRDIAIDVIGPEGVPWVPFLATMFIFIFVVSVFEVVPAIQFPVTSRAAIPVMLAFVCWILYNAAGIKKKGLGGYLKAVMFPPGVPKPIYILLTPIEFVSTIVIRPFTLAIRLFANLFAGHLLLAVFYVATAYLIQPKITALFSIASFAMTVFLTGLEVFVSVIQAYVFTILTAVYIAGAVSTEH